MSKTYKSIIKDGLWYKNPGLVQFLGLCPLLAVSTSFKNGATLGIATIIVLTCSNLLIAILKNIIPFYLRIPIFVLIIAGFVTLCQITLAAVNYNLYHNLGLFLALITTNCAVLGRIEAFAYKNTPRKALLDGLMQGLGFTLVLIFLGFIREVFTSTTKLTPVDSEFLFFILPPGAFIILGFLIAFKNYLGQKN